jgi:DNA-binding NtrC family response regulator
MKNFYDSITIPEICIKADYPPATNNMKKRILIVEDEPLILFSLSTALQSELTEVKTTSNGRNALQEIAASKHFDLYIIDITLPDMNGCELIEIVAQQQPLAQFIVMTGRYRDKQSMLDQMEGAAAIEPFHFMTKPFDIDETQEMVFQILTNVV